MEFTVEYSMWAPFADTNPEPDDELPNYGDVIDLGELNKFQYTPAMNEAKAYGNSVLARYLALFKEGTANVTLLDVLNENKAKVLGANVDEEGTLTCSVNDKPPYGGYGCIAGTLLAGNKQGFYGLFLPKIKATIQGKELNTNGENLALTPEMLAFTYSAAKNGVHFIQSKYFDTPAEAKAWVVQLFTKSSGASVQAAQAKAAARASV